VSDTAAHLDASAGGAGQRIAAAATDGRTRDRVARLLLELGPSTAAALGERLGLSPAAIRRHLDAMVVDGTISARSAHPRPRRGRGRPARLYQLTDAGHAAGPTAYEEIAAEALRQLADLGGPGAVRRFADTRAAALERRIRTALAEAERAPGPVDPLSVLAAAMTDAGYATSVSRLPSGNQICQHHCPVQHVAELFPVLCEAETLALSRLIDSHVQRLATIAHGDGVCTTHIPTHPPARSSAADGAPAEGPAPERGPDGPDGPDTPAAAARPETSAHRDDPARAERSAQSTTASSEGLAI
jgi:predicted ArsR family transcriptional regulator